MNDLTALNNSFGKIGEQPTFVEDYAELWAKYKENDGRTWKKLCERLKSHREANDVVTFFSREAKDSLKKYTYLLPTFCFKGVEKILDTLIMEEVADSHSHVQPYFKLFGLTKKFGVNAKAVLVAETRKATAGNKIQESRGAELEILTLQEDLDHIGEQLKNLFEKGTRSTH